MNIIILISGVVLAIGTLVTAILNRKIDLNGSHDYLWRFKNSVHKTVIEYVGSGSGLLCIQEKIKDNYGKVVSWK